MSLPTWHVESTGYAVGARPAPGLINIEPRATITSGTNRYGDGPERVVFYMTGSWIAVPEADILGGLERSDFMRDVRAMVAQHNAALIAQEPTP